MKEKHRQSDTTQRARKKKRNIKKFLLFNKEMENNKWAKHYSFSSLPEIDLGKK